MTVIIPPRLRCRPLDRRGYVIPFAQFIEDGVPNFAVMDHDKVLTCFRARLCGICGDRLGKHVYFVGGSLCVKHRFFYDPPMHRECAVYALQACPHLARSKGRYREPPAIEGAKIIVGDMVTTKSPYYALMHTTSFSYGRTPEGMLVASAGPWLDVEYWKDGASVGASPPVGATP